MAKFSVNTHHAYLNNEIVIKCDDPVSIIDKSTGEHYDVIGEHKINLSAGKHVLTTDGCEEEIIIEDAIKLGGGRYKKAFVFDDSPWVFLVMKDRTYIMNIETQEEKIEYNVTPNVISSLGMYQGHANIYFLFQTSKDYSIYDICSGKHIISFTDHIYSNSNYVIYKDKESVIIYDYRTNKKIDVFQGQYSFGNKFYFIKDYNLYGLDLSSTKIDKIDYVGSVPNNSILFENTLLKIRGDYSKQKETYYKSYIFYELGDGKNGITSTNLLFPYFIDNWFGTETEEFQHVKEERDDFVVNNKEKIYKNVAQVCFGLRFNQYSIRQYKEKKELVFKGELITYPDLFRLKPSFTMKSTLGSAFTIKNISFNTNLENLCLDKSTTEKQKPNIPDGEELVASSISNKRVITRKDDCYYYYDFSKDYSLSIFVNFFDRTRYSNAYFTSDGKNVVLQISKTEGQLLGIDNLQTTKFEVEGFTVARNEGYNGYKPEIKILEGRKPVWRDPITLEMISEEKLSYHIFMSPDGKYSADTKMKTIIFNRLTKAEIDNKEYQQLKEKYNWNRDTEEKKRNAIIKLREQLVDSSDEYDLFGKLIEANNRCFSHVGDVEERKRKQEKPIKDDIDRYINKESDFVCLFIDKLSYVTFRENKKETDNKQILIGRSVYFLNYVSFSYDNKYLSFAAKLNTDEFRFSQEGVFVIYDLKEEKIVNRIENYQSNQLLAVWMTLFSKKGDIAFYDSCANAYLLKANANYREIIQAPGKSLLCFSPSGRFIAFSDQNYIDYTHHPDGKWGHQPSGNVFIHEVDKFEECIEQYNDMGDGILGVACHAGNVSSAAFSQDEKRLLVVGNDGVVVIRNLKETSMKDNDTHKDEEYETDSTDDDYGTHYGEYAGTYAQDVMGYSDDVINDAFDGDPDAYWNID